MAVDDQRQNRRKPHAGEDDPDGIGCLLVPQGLRDLRDVHPLLGEEIAQTVDAQLLETFLGEAMILDQDLHEGSLLVGESTVETRQPPTEKVAECDRQEAVGLVGADFLLGRDPAHQLGELRRTHHLPHGEDQDHDQEVDVSRAPAGVYRGEAEPEERER